MGDALSQSALDAIAKFYASGREVTVCEQRASATLVFNSERLMRLFSIPEKKPRKPNKYIEDKRRSGSKSRAAVLAAWNEGLSVNGIAAKLGKHPNTISLHMTALRNSGDVAQGQRACKPGTMRARIIAAADGKRSAAVIAEMIGSPVDSVRATISVMRRSGIEVPVPRQVSGRRAHFAQGS